MKISFTSNVTLNILDWIFYIHIYILNIIHCSVHLLHLNSQ